MNKEVNIFVEKDDNRKKKVVCECDDAFAIGICPRDDFEELFQKIAKNAFFIVAEDKKSRDVLGYAALYANDLNTRIAYITLICVKAYAQRDHIGTRILEKCDQIAVDNQMTKVRLEVYSDNDKAIAFYKKNGYVFEMKKTEYSYNMIKQL